MDYERLLDFNFLRKLANNICILLPATSFIYLYIKGYGEYYLSLSIISVILIGFYLNVETTLDLVIKKLAKAKKDRNNKVENILNFVLEDKLFLFCYLLSVGLSILALIELGKNFSNSNNKLLFIVGIFGLTYLLVGMVVDYYYVRRYGKIFKEEKKIVIKTLSILKKKK